mmetsp:Transcript_10580/g.38894  ORF Transcript_10580/g.38894 Transcript_10580/m.38894 type:complete len:325 (+) Transcript_10580:3-977(+)
MQRCNLQMGCLAKREPLRINKLRVEASLGDQFLVSALLLDLAFVHDRYLVGTLHSTQAVRNHERRATLQEPRQGALDLRLAHPIECGCGLIQYDDWCILQQCPCDCNALPLPSAEKAAALADIGVKPVAKLLDEAQCVGIPRSLLHLSFFVRAVDTTVADVLFDTRAEQHGVLIHHRDVGHPVLHLHVVRRHAIHRNVAHGGLVETAQQVDQSGLARARGANQGGHLATRQRQIQPLDHLLVGPSGVREVNVLEAHVNPVVGIHHLDLLATFCDVTGCLGSILLSYSNRRGGCGRGRLSFSARCVVAVERRVRDIRLQQVVDTP